MPTEFNTTHTDEIVCPWCGHEHQDSWEMADGVHWCGACSKEFRVNINVIVTYTTTKEGA